MILLDSICRSFGSQQVLSDVTFSVPEGTVTSLLGPNGAGKTTILKLLMGLIEPTIGVASICGDASLPRTAQSLKQTGCLIDGYEPPGATTVQQLLSLNIDVSSDFDENRARELLANKQIGIQTTWKSMSKGQKRWTLLTMLLCRRCRILLLDEPADGLDPESRQELYQLIRREANEHGIAALITTHIINDIEKVTDDVCVIKGGQILLHAELEDLREQVMVIETKEESNLPVELTLFSSTQGNTYTYWLRGDLAKLPSEVRGEIRRRRPALEELYLAVVQSTGETSGALADVAAPANPPA